MNQDSETFFSQPFLFEWDDGNRNKNEGKHGVKNEECEQIFLNRPLIVAEDGAHSQKEARHFALGRTNDGRLLFAAFTVRGEKLRVISARDMSRQERRIYQNEKA